MYEDNGDMGRILSAAVGKEEPLPARKAADQLGMALARRLVEPVAEPAVGAEAALLLHPQRIAVVLVATAPEVLELQRTESPADECAHRLGNQPAPPIGRTEPIAHLGIARTDGKVAPLGEEQPDAPHDPSRLEQFDGIGLGSREDHTDNQEALGHTPVRQPPRRRTDAPVAGQSIELGRVRFCLLYTSPSPRDA